MTRDAEFCVYDAELIASLSCLKREDKLWLSQLGWPGYHVYEPISCASGCSHCQICEPSCTADWGLYM